MLCCLAWTVATTLFGLAALAGGRSSMAEEMKHALLVEDEESVRNMTEKMLRARDYEVTAANDGDEGWDLLQQDSDKFTFVLSDVVMPSLGEWELYEKCREEGINLPFVFMSGYTHGVGDGDSPEDKTWVFLQKPFSIEQLVHCIESVVRE
jgi:two-component system cell cycle sensor histidine kinase/response regulator CckA